MLEFNVGELVTRLRRALGVRGRMPLGLDEHVIPVTITADVTGAPWRTNPKFGQGSQSFTTAVAGNFATTRLVYPVDAKGGRDSVFLLTGFNVQPANYVIATGNPVGIADANVATAHFEPQYTPTASTIIHLITSELVSEGANVFPFRLPIGLQADISASAPTLGASGQLFVTRSGLQGQADFQPVEMLIRRGQAVRFASQWPASGTDRSGILVCVQGLYYGLGG